MFHNIAAENRSHIKLMFNSLFKYYGNAGHPARVSYLTLLRTL